MRAGSDPVRAVFLDRDGVINSDRDDYVKNVGELRIFPFAPVSIKRLNDAGWPVFVVSNQQGVAKGIIAEDDLAAMEHEISRQVADIGGKITKFYYCKHLAAAGCSCRKPKPGMILKAAQENGVNTAESVMVGDTAHDIAAGKSAGCRAVLVLTGKLTRAAAGNLPHRPDYVADNLSGAVDFILTL